MWVIERLPGWLLFACSSFTSTGGGASGLPSPKIPAAPSRGLISPRLDHIRVDIELGGQLSQRLLALHSSKRHLRLEGRAMVPARSSRHGVSCSRHHAAVRQKIHLSQMFRWPEPAPPAGWRGHASRSYILARPGPPVTRGGLAPADRNACEIGEPRFGRGIRRRPPIAAWGERATGTHLRPIRHHRALELAGGEEVPDKHP